MGRSFSQCEQMRGEARGASLMLPASENRFNIRYTNTRKSRGGLARTTHRVGCGRVRQLCCLSVCAVERRRPPEHSVGFRDSCSRSLGLCWKPEDPQGEGEAWSSSTKAEVSLRLLSLFIPFRLKPIGCCHTEGGSSIFSKSYWPHPQPCCSHGVGHFSFKWTVNYHVSYVPAWRAYGVLNLLGWMLSPVERPCTSLIVGNKGSTQPLGLLDGIQGPRKW